jgi:site-specific recombinase XerD
MASLFKRKIKDGTPSKVWYVAYTDHEGRRRMVKGFTEKDLTQRLAAKIESEVMLRKRGMIEPSHDRVAEQRRKPLSAHLAEFEIALKGRNRTSKHVSLTMLRIRKVIDGCGYTRLADLETDSIESYLQTLKTKEGFGHKTYNHYLQALESFSRWLIEKKRLTANPIRGIVRLNNEVDVRHRRRALSASEVSKLVAAARSSTKKIQKYTGEQRSRVYLLSYMTGLRRSELASLTPASFNLAADQPTIPLEAACSKHRRTDVLPLHPELVLMLREWLKGVTTTEKLFPLLDRKKVWFMVKKDLERAGIEYETQDGIADFHAAGRHSYITGLVRGGATLVQAKELARHSDVRMTMRYTHVGMDDKAKALNSLPLPTGLQRFSSALAGSERHFSSPNGNGKDKKSAECITASDSNSDTSNSNRHRLSSDGNEAEKRRARGSNPQPVSRHHISSVAANHSLTLRKSFIINVLWLFCFLQNPV